MVWQLEGESYLVQLPDFYMMRRMFIQEGGVQNRDALIANTKFLAFRKKNSIDYIYAMDINDHERRLPGEIVLSHFANAKPNDLTKCESGLHDIHVMLIPLDKDGRPVSWEMKQQFRNGNTISIGHLIAQSGEPVRPKGNKFKANLSLCDSGIQDPVDWFYCDGCLVSKYPIFRDNALHAWNALYTF